MFQYQIPQPERKIKIQRDTRPSARVESTVEALAEQFFPASPTTLKRVHESIREGDKPEVRDKLVMQIKSDPAIFLYCVKNLNSLVETEKRTVDPIKEIRELEFDKLRSLLNVNSRQISPHRRERASELQALRLQHSIVSSTAASNIAEQVDIESDLAYSAAVFRQLGLHLVAWGQPKIYSQAMVLQRRKGTELEDEIRLLLGISPSEMGARLAMKWGLSTELRTALSADIDIAKTNDEAHLLSHSSEELRLLGVCETSELYSKSRDAKNFPQAHDRWQESQPKIEKLVGHEVFEEIEDQAKESLLEHSKEVHSLAKLAFIADEVAALSRSVVEELSNEFLRSCSAQAKEKFEEVYHLIPTSGVAADAIKVLVEEAIPLVGFERGCLFLLNKRSLSITPALRIGSEPLASYSKLLSQNRQAFLDTLESHIPLRLQGFGVHSEVISYVLGALHNSLHPGVLYLELTRSAEREPGHASIVLFNLVRQALDHCLAGKS